MENELLTENQLEQALQTLDVAWSLIPGQGLVRVFETKSFTEGLALVGRLATVAAKHQHDPDVHLTANEVELTLTTQEVGGVTSQDVDVAREIDEIMKTPGSSPNVQ